MKANLHLHSRYSDGTLWPAEIVARAKGFGLEAVALTDHDSMEGAGEFLGAAKGAGLTAYAAVEVDCEDSFGAGGREYRYRSEMLGYFPGGEARATRALLDGRLASRLERAGLMLRGAAERFGDPSLSLDDFLRHKAGPDAAGRADARFSCSKSDIFNYLKARGKLPRRAGYRAFKGGLAREWLARGGRKEKEPGVAEVIATIRADGGFAVLPHPGHEFEDLAFVMKNERKVLAAMLDRFEAFGLSGVELYYYGTPGGKKINRMVAEAARARGLFLSCGSDCHGPGSAKDTMGKFAGDFAGFPGGK